MKIFLFVLPFLPFIIGAAVFEIVLCAALMKTASINSRQEEAMRSQAELRRQRNAGVTKN